MKRILVPLDGSKLAEQVLPHVRRLARILDARAVLLHAIPDVEHESMLAAGITGRYPLDVLPEHYGERQQHTLHMMRRHAEDYLTTQATRLRHDGYAVEIDIRIGPAAESIVECAADRLATLVAMATQGHSGLRPCTLSSVTDKVVRASMAPVFVVRGDACAPATDRPLKRVLVPLDGSTLATAALPFATDLAARASAELLLLQVVTAKIGVYSGIGLPGPESDVPAALRSQAAHALGRVAELLRPRVQVTPIVAAGYAPEMIVDEAARRGVDLIVMATHGRSDLRRWALGSMVDNVLQATTAPLILVRAQPQQCYQVLQRQRPHGGQRGGQVDQ